ncbi:MAG TPA: DUF998 domain-containing protein [Streptosporangiaceae bacterium]
MHAAEADIPDSATSRRGMLPALAGLVVGLAYAAISVYWAVGGRWLLNTVGISLSQPGQAGHLAALLGVWAAAGVKAFAAVLPLLAIGVWPRTANGGLRRLARVLTWVEAAILIGYGLVLTASGLLVQAGAIKAAAHADRLALKWHAYLWDPWFLIWGIFVFLALWRSRPASQDHLPGRYCLLVEPASARGRPARWTRGLLYCGLAAGPVFVTTFLAEGATRDGYRPSRHPVSSLALGPRGQVQAANFAVTGTLVLAGAAGLGRAADPALSSRAGRALIGVAGAGLIGAAVFATDPVSGYPPGTPDALTQPSRIGMMHNLAAVPVFLGLPAAAFTCSWQSVRTGHRGFGLYCAATATTMLATMALAGAGFNQSPRLVNLAGLFQRASIATGFGWLTALCARALTRAPAASGRKPSA